MTVVTRLMRVGPAAESLGVYVPALVFQKAVALGRVVLFSYLMVQEQVGLWGLAAMIFTIGSSVATLGSNHGITRYVSFYEARGQLVGFYRRMRLGVVVLALATTAAALAGSGVLTRLLMPQDSAGAITYDQQWVICVAALANVAAVALHNNLGSFLHGMRVYRLVALLEVVYSVLFAAAAAVVLLLEPTALAALATHFAVIVTVVAFGTIVLAAGLRAQASAGQAGTAPAGPAEPLAADPTVGIDQAAAPVPDAMSAPPPQDALDLTGAMPRVLRFGLANLLGTSLWLAAGYVSFWLASKEYGPREAGTFHVFLRLGQPVMLLANAAWAVIFTYVARQWEGGERAPAMAALKTAYKGIAVTMLTLTLVLYATGPLWVKVLRSDYHAGLPLIGGLLMFFQVVTNLALMNIVAKLRERPIVIALAALCGGTANLVLAKWWMPRYGPAGAAWAAGIGMYAGGMLVAVVYLLVSRVRLGAATWAVLLSPAILALLITAPWVALGVWAAVLALAVLTPLLFSREEKALIASFVRRFAAIATGRKGA